MKFAYLRRMETIARNVFFSIFENFFNIFIIIEIKSDYFEMKLIF